MSDDDWDAPITLQAKPAVRYNDDEDEVAVDAVDTAETTKAKKPLDAKQELLKASAQVRGGEAERRLTHTARANKSKRSARPSWRARRNARGVPGP